MTTIRDAVAGYIASVSSARSLKTAETYGNALRKFLEVLTARNVDTESTPAGSLSEEAVAWFAAYLKDYTVATESLYLVAVKGFYDYLAAEGLGSPNTLRIKTLIRQRSRRTGPRLPQFPREAIEKVIQYAFSLASVPTEDEFERLRLLRDRAFIVTLADTGLRVHEACKLRRADIDMFELRGIVIGKGDKEAVIRFSERAMRAIKDYLSARQLLDGSSGRPMGSLPVFARHNKSSLKKVRPISRITGYAIVTQRVNEALPEGSDVDRSAITPHSFRHYFVTTVLRGSGNLKLAQELARHKNIAVTQRYAHLNDDELDKGYRDIFDEDQ